MKLLLEMKSKEVPKLVGHLLDAAERCSTDQNFVFVEMTSTYQIEVCVAGYNEVLKTQTRTGQIEIARVTPTANRNVTIHLRNCFSWELAEIVRKAIKSSPRSIREKVLQVYEVV